MKLRSPLVFPDGTSQSTAAGGGAGPTRVTTLPASPVDGQEIRYVADATNGILFPLRYNAGSASAYKWESVGEGSLYSEVTTNEATASSAYVNLTTVGPSITLPLAGDWEIEIGGFVGSGSAFMYMSYAIGATAAVDADSIRNADASGDYSNIMRTRRKTGLAAATALVAKYKNSAAVTGVAEARWMRARPIRVG